MPSDEAVLEAYDTCLREEQGHFTCLDTLLQVEVLQFRVDLHRLCRVPFLLFVFAAQERGGVRFLGGGVSS